LSVAWLLMDRGKKGIGGSGSGVVLLILLVLAPVILVVAGYGLCSARIAVPDARALKAAGVIVLVAKAAVAGYQAVHVILYTGAFRDQLRPLGWHFLALEVIPSVVWAAVLALTRIPAVAPPAPDGPTAGRQEPG